MGFNANKKKEYEDAALECLKKKEYAKGWFLVAKAAEYGFALAESCEGLLAEAYLKDANELVLLAKQIKEKSKLSPSNEEKPLQKTSNDEDISSAKAAQWIISEKPNVRLDDVAGLEEVKRVIREDVLYAMNYADAFAMCKIPPGSGALMYGPPGNGKTYIAKAIAGELDATFFSVSGSQIKSKYVGEAEKNMRALFEEAAKYPRAVIFIDEIHSLLGRRGNEKIAVIDEFLVLADGIVERKNNLLILGATNYPWLLDDAVFRRLGHLIYVGMPDDAARKKIFELQFVGVPHENDFPFEHFAEKAKRFSGADIKQICSTAKKRSIARMVETSAKEPLITRQDVFDAIETMKPTVREELLEKYRNWSKS